MALLDSKKRIVAVKYNGTVSGTDAIDVSNEDVRISFELQNGEYKRLNGVKGSKDTWQNDDNVTGTLSLECMLRGNDSTGLALDTPPQWSPVFKLCSLTETIGVDDVTYKPNQTQPLDSQAAVWVDGKKRVLSKALGSLTISGTKGEPAKMSASLTGYTTVTETTEANPTANDDLNSLLIVKSIDSLTVAGQAMKVDAFTFTQNATNEYLYGINIKDNDNTDFDATLELVFYKDTAYTYDVYSQLIAGTSVAVAIQIGSVDGKAVKFAAPRAIVQGSPSESTINGKEAVTVTYSLQSLDGTGTDNFLLTFGTM